jgi:hypothetical protein
VTRRFAKICPIFLKVAQTVCKPKKAKIFTTKHNLKAQNIYIKPLLKPENVINLLKQKVAQSFTISSGYFIFSKNHYEPPKVAQLVKDCPIWSP